MNLWTLQFPREIPREDLAEVTRQRTTAETKKPFTKNSNLLRYSGTIFGIIASANHPPSENLLMNRDRLTAQLIFYPTLGWNMLLAKVLHVRRWWDQVHENIILGAMPLKWDVKGLAETGVKAVVNTCEEYAGPVELYAKYEIEQFRMPTVDFTHPKFGDVERAVAFMDQQIADGNKVYVHCKAGRARSATVVMCWMIKNLQKPAVEIQKTLNYFRPHINQHLPQRPVIQEFEAKYLRSK